MENKNKKDVKKDNNEDPIKEVRIRVVGVGGGGGLIISGISPNLKKVLFAVLNTDSRAVEEVTKEKKIKGIVFGNRITDGLGTGMKPELGKRAAEEDIEEVKPLFKDQDVVIFVASLGGGTGSGALSVFASAARAEGALVYGVFTLPFSFEGDKKMKIAKDAIKESSPHLHAITILPNEKIFELVDKNTPLKKALSVMNDNLAFSLEGLVETIYETGLINIDFADVRAILEARRGPRKLAYLNTIEANLDEGAQEIIRRATSNPLYPYSVENSRGILFNISGGKDIGLADVSSISENLYQHTENDAKVIIGIMQKNKYKNKIKISLLATGCGTDFFAQELESEEEKEKNIEPTEEKKSVEEKKKTTSSPKKRKVKKKKTIKKKQPKEKEITVVSTNEKFSPVVEESPKEPENEEEKEILEREKKWDKPSFLRRFKK